jgi:hypothetical protein
MSCEAHQLAVSRRFLDWADVDTIRELVASLPKERTVIVVDLGAGSGTTSGSVFAERREKIEVTTYDLVADPALHSTAQFLKNIGIGDQWACHEMDSVEAAGKWQNGYADLLMIDTSHEYEHTVAELAAWRPKLRRNGRVWLHDYRGGYPGVTQAVDEAVARGEFKLLKVAGLGCVLRPLR